MADGGTTERQGLGKSLKSQAKYGTTATVASTNETFIKHRLSQNETLQGIALKYGCTVSKYVKSQFFSETQKSWKIQWWIYRSMMNESSNSNV